MSSTDTPLSELLASFHEKEFLPVQELLQESRASLIVPGPDAQCGTYYLERSKKSMEPADFELDLKDLHAVARALQSLWDAPDLSALNSLAAKILALAPHFEEIEVDEDVSPFIYVMF